MGSDPASHELILARGPSGRVRHWWRPQWCADWAPLCGGASWARERDLDRTSEIRLCPRCARLVPETPLLEVTP